MLTFVGTSPPADITPALPAGQVMIRMRTMQVSLAPEVGREGRRYRLYDFSLEAATGIIARADLDDHDGSLAAALPSTEYMFYVVEDGCSTVLQFKGRFTEQLFTSQREFLADVRAGT